MKTEAQKSDEKEVVKADAPVEDKEMTEEDAVKEDAAKDDKAEDNDPLLTSEAPDKEIVDDDEEPKRKSLWDELSDDEGEESK